MNCCNKNCNQGRECPNQLRPLDDADKIELFAFTLIGVATLAVLWIWG